MLNILIKKIIYKCVYKLLQYIMKEGREGRRVERKRIDGNLEIMDKFVGIKCVIVLYILTYPNSLTCIH